MVEVTGLEPAASWSQTRHSTKLSYTSVLIKSANDCRAFNQSLIIIAHQMRLVNKKFFSFGEFNLILLINPNPAYLTLVRYAFLITTSLSGLLLASTSTAAILSTTLSPSYTCPNTV